MYYYDGGDTWNYFQDGVALADLFEVDWKEYILSWVDTSYLPQSLIYASLPRALLMSRFVSLGCIITHDNYWIISVYFSILSFAGVWLLVQQLSRFFPQTQPAIGIAWLVYPSFVFWSSGILKESIAVGLISLLVAWSLQLYFQGERRWYQIWPYWIGWGIAAYLLWIMKYYYAAALIPVLLSLILAKKVNFSPGFPLLKLAGIFAVLILVPTLLHPNLSVHRVMDVIVKNHDVFIKISNPENVINFYELDSTIGSMLLNAPLALVSAWYRPLLGETHGWLQHLAGIENLLVLAVSLLAVFQIYRHKGIFPGQLPWLLGGIAFAVILGVLLAFSAPNFGTLMRYKVAFAPYILYLSLIPLLRKLRSRSNIDRYIG
uniref:Uncharacterized protein n=1 Tax=Roseihalotalea indica TaxID=2867963 RepID=A0AA49GQQ6_9BACT|nr:hypothetical protein K4G66_30090 [Tunicatimonas sp. TK19036]